MVAKYLIFLLLICLCFFYLLYSYNDIDFDLQDQYTYRCICLVEWSRVIGIGKSWHHNDWKRLRRLNLGLYPGKRKCHRNNTIPNAFGTKMKRSSCRIRLAWWSWLRKTAEQWQTVHGASSSRVIGRSASRQVELGLDTYSTTTEPGLSSRCKFRC